MKRNFLILLMLAALTYGAVAFILLELNPAMWSIQCRLFSVVATLVLGGAHFTFKLLDEIAARVMP